MPRRLSLARMGAADASREDLAIGDINRDKQGRGAVPVVVVSNAFLVTQTQRQRPESPSAIGFIHDPTDLL